MTAHKSSLVHPKYKTKYRVGTWKEYERGLRRRGDVTIYFTEAALAEWIPPTNGKRGGQRQHYSCTNAPLGRPRTLRRGPFTSTNLRS